MAKEKDIFDKIMELSVLRIFNPFYTKYKEILLYLFFGGLSFIVSISSFAIANVTLGLNEHIANLISWVLAVTFAYVTNRKWVFDSTVTNAKELIKEIVDFYGGRVLTLIIEELVLFVFITKLHFSSVVVKVIAQIVVIILNYVLSKLFVFKDKSNE